VLHLNQELKNQEEHNVKSLLKKRKKKH